MHWSQARAEHRLQAHIPVDLGRWETAGRYTGAGVHKVRECGVQLSVLIAWPTNDNRVFTCYIAG